MDDSTAGLGIEPVTADSALPAGWRMVAAAPDPAGRRRAALALWPRDVLDLLPQFAELFADRLLDVRVGRLRGDLALAYLARADSGAALVWMGWAPGPPGGREPVFWGRLPAPARRFLIEVHAGFAGPDGDSYGLAQPAGMVTYAEWAGFDGRIPGWARTGRISSDRLMFVTGNGDLLRLCVSPDLPEGRLAIVYEGDVDPQDFWPTLDELMTGRFADE